MSFVYSKNNQTKMNTMPSSTSLGISSVIFFLLFFFSFFASVAQAVVPPSKTFKYINQGEFGDVLTEYGGTYRVVGLNSIRPFALYYYNITPGAYTLGIRLASANSESLMRWVWEANRGNPVGENATLTFGADGNLVLADANGRIAWQTGTANKGVVDIELLPNGNLVLKDSRGGFVWQSFDHPTDTMLVGASLRLTGPTKLVSRKSQVDGSPGPYSLVIESNRLVLYYKSKNSPKPLQYYTTGEFISGRPGAVKRVVFNASRSTDEIVQYELTFELYEDNTGGSSAGSLILAPPKFNATYSMLRLGIDGNLRVYTHIPNAESGKWEISYILFNRDDDRFFSAIRVSECSLPSKCGSLGVCEDDMCVACPLPKGLMGWSKTCAPPTLPPCNGGNNVKYYKVVGVEHFMNSYTEGEGPMTVSQCGDSCIKDCGCLGFFYREESSKCLLAPELDTLIKVSNQTHVAYIKMSKQNVSSFPSL